jgi:hypothetical protein
MMCLPSSRATCLTLLLDFVSRDTAEIARSPEKAGGAWKPQSSRPVANLRPGGMRVCPAGYAGKGACACRLLQVSNIRLWPSPPKDRWGDTSSGRPRRRAYVEET